MSKTDWTPDTLQASYAMLAAEIDRRYEQRFAAQQNSWTALVTSIRETYDAQLTDLGNQIQEKRDHLSGMLQMHSEGDVEAIAAVRHSLDDLAAVFDHRIKELQRAHDLALANQKEAGSKVESANEARFAAVNEFRGQLSDQARLLIPRAEAQALITSLDQKIAILNTRMDKAEGRGDGGLATRNAIYAAVATLVAVLSIALAIYTNARHGGR